MTAARDVSLLLVCRGGGVQQYLGPRPPGNIDGWSEESMCFIEGTALIRIKQELLCLRQLPEPAARAKEHCSTQTCSPLQQLCMSMSTILWGKQSSWDCCTPLERPVKLLLAALLGKQLRFRHI